ncbi:MAG: selenium-dependent molybdenum cofactor biosynthesis protein YqeB [Vallitalea sp.]|jgi:xanthine dehydrogenase accessory factor|nr:selenium-dependent molybdenum cofactor biosynthesis protein YqeB [Vallitalea sp.]
MNNNLVVVRGGGDIASGTIHKLARCGFQVVVLEVNQPTVIRRTVSFANAIYEKQVTIEGIKAVKTDSEEDAMNILHNGYIPVLIDEIGKSIEKIQPEIVIDAILAKKNLGTNIKMANIVIGLGPGFIAGMDVHAVIETNRGHNLGKVILQGKSYPNTGIPGNIQGYTSERVIRSTTSGIVNAMADIGDIVKKNQCIGYINDTPILATIDGVIRGLIHSGIYVTKDFKIGDIDPRGEINNCNTISDKARAIGGGVLEAILMLSLT